MTNTDEQIGRNVAAHRDRGELSQKDLAERMREQGWKWSQATVWSVEKGERPLRLAEAQDLASILSTYVGQLTWADGFTQTQSAMHRLGVAHEALKEAISEFKLSQWELARVADDAGEDVYNSNFRTVVEEWLTKSPTAVAREVVLDDEAEGLKERFLSGGVVSDDEATELRRAFRERSGPFQKLLDEQWEPSGIDQEAS